MTTAARILIPALLLTTLLLAACGEDDPASPEPETWQEVALNLAAGDSRMVAVDFMSGHGVALGLVVTGPSSKADVHEILRLQPDGSWLADETVTLRSGVTALDVAVNGASALILAGYQLGGPSSVVVDLRGVDPLYVELGTSGMLTVDCESSFVVAGGRVAGGAGGLWSSTVPGTWTHDALPLTGTNDSGFRDVDVRGGVAVACGYDDGADTLQVLLTRTPATGWTHIKPVAAQYGTYFCVARNDAGTIYVGGIHGAGGPSPRAFLIQRSISGDWTELVLPDAERLHGVMDILVADDGDIYLACMGEGDDTEANLLRADAGGVHQEIEPFPGGLLQVDQADDGTVFAVGFRRDEATGDETGVMLRQAP